MAHTVGSMQAYDEGALQATQAMCAHAFEALQAHFTELPKLDCSVNLLFGHEQAEHYLDWVHGKHGIQVEFDDPWTHEKRSATFLPDIAPREGMSKREAIDALINKAGCRKRNITESLRERVTVVRYQSSLVDMTFDEFNRVSNGTTHNHVAPSKRKFHTA